MMKNFTLSLALFLSTLTAFSQGNWTQQANFGGAERVDAIGFSIGTKGYLGTGRNWITAAEYVDFWEFDPSTNAWTQKADFAGGARHSAVGFSVNNKGYAGTGINVNGPVYFNDFWEYDPQTNIWIQKTNFSGSARYGACGFSTGNSGYIGTGYDGVWKKDFWEYNTLTDTWVQKTDFGGSARYTAASFSINGKGYLGTGQDNSTTALNDFWQFDPTNNSWSQIANFAGSPRWVAIGFSLLGEGYVGTGVSNSGTYSDMWSYNPGTNAWTQVADFGGGLRHSGVGIAIGNKGYAGTGTNAAGLYNDFWEFQTTTNCTPDITTGLVGNYPFSGNASDVSGNANNGSVIGATLTTDRFGNPNSAYSFNGTSDYINCGNSPTFDLNTFTISAWVYKQSTGIAGGIVTKSTGAVGEIGYRLEIDQSDKGSVVWSRIGIIQPGTGYVFSNTVLNNSNWYHLTAVKSSDTIKIYVNCILENITTGMTSAYNNANPLLIGTNFFNSTMVNYFTGKIDDVRIYNRALSECDIDSLCNIPDFTGVDEHTQANNITIFPNPTDGILFIQGIKNETTTVFNVLGEVVKISKAGNSIDISSFDKGLYLIQVSDNNNKIIYTTKILKNQ